MTKRESTYLERLKARRSVLAARLALSLGEGRKRLSAEIREEYKALNWAIKEIEAWNAVVREKV